MVVRLQCVCAGVVLAWSWGTGSGDQSGLPLAVAFALFLVYVVFNVLLLYELWVHICAGQRLFLELLDMCPLWDIRNLSLSFPINLLIFSVVVMVNFSLTSFSPPRSSFLESPLLISQRVEEVPPPPPQLCVQK